MTQIYDIGQDDHVYCRNEDEQVDKKFRKPLYGYAFPPRADVCFEGKYYSNLALKRRLVDSTFNPMQICILPKQVNIGTK